MRQPVREAVFAMKNFYRTALIAVVLLSAAGAIADSSDSPRAEATASEPAPAETQSTVSPVEEQRNACKARCDAVESNCGSSVRRATKQCMKLAATGGVDPWTRRRDYAGYYCGFFRGNHCAGVSNPQRCLDRYAVRLNLCNDWFYQNTASAYFDCRTSETESLTLCRDELRDCHAACDY